MPKYSLSTDGKILADNQTIGFLHGDLGDYSLDIKVATSAENTIKALIFDRMRSGGPKQGRPLIEVLVPQAEANQDMESREEFPPPLPPEAPPAPPMDPKLGDKTPVYMQWMATYFPEKYRKLYRGRKTHLTTGLNPHLSGGDVPDSHFAKEPESEWR